MCLTRNLFACFFKWNSSINLINDRTLDSNQNLDHKTSKSDVQYLGGTLCNSVSHFMFSSSMGGKIFLHSKMLSTNVTGKWFFPSVDSLVSYKNMVHQKPLPTYFTAVWLLTSMAHFVFLQTCCIIITSSTNVTHIPICGGMYSFMSPQVIISFEHLSTNIAYKWCAVWMNRPMIVELSTTDKSFPTCTAFVRFFTCVFTALVIGQIFKSGICFVTLIALECLAWGFLWSLLLFG